MGVTLYFLLSGRLPFDHSEDYVLKRMIRQSPIQFQGGESNTVWDKISVECQDLITKFLIRDPSKRYFVYLL